jgi:hypothetical protein
MMLASVQSSLRADEAQRNNAEQSAITRSSALRWSRFFAPRFIDGAQM